jgi:hypothetical protein
MSNEKSIKEIIREEYLKCAGDPIYFLKKFVFIQTSEGRMLFTPYLFQEKLLYLLNKHDRTLILKSRQLGITTLTAAYALWLMLFKKDQSILALAPTQEKARNIVDKVRFAYSQLPSWLKIAALEDNKLSLILENGSKIKAASGASESARGYTANVLILDEAAFIENAEETENYRLCGDVREFEEVSKMIKSDNGYLNLKNHGFLIYSNNLEQLENMIDKMIFSYRRSK